MAATAVVIAVTADHRTAVLRPEDRLAAEVAIRRRRRMAQDPLAAALAAVQDRTVAAALTVAARMAAVVALTEGIAEFSRIQALPNAAVSGRRFFRRDNFGSSLMSLCG